MPGNKFGVAAAGARKSTEVPTQVPSGEHTQSGEAAHQILNLLYVDWRCLLGSLDGVLMRRHGVGGCLLCKEVVGDRTSDYANNCAGTCPDRCERAVVSGSDLENESYKRNEEDPDDNRSQIGSKPLRRGCVRGHRWRRNHARGGNCACCRASRRLPVSRQQCVCLGALLSPDCGSGLLLCKEVRGNCPGQDSDDTTHSAPDGRKVVQRFGGTPQHQPDKGDERDCHQS
jgi:hypothetical protein